VIEVRGNIWVYEADVKCITTNGYVRKDGAAVMGRGVALQCKTIFPGIEFNLGAMIAAGGNVVHRFGEPPRTTHPLYSFPVKVNWNEKARLELIELSAIQLAAMPFSPDSTVVLPRPGCGNGELKWEQVKPVIEGILDDRFHVIDLP
jgi:hypothetical protein